MRSTWTTRLAAVTAIATLAIAGLAGPASSGNTTITRGTFEAFAAGANDPDYTNVTGRAKMVRTAGGNTIVTIHVTGLLPNTSYPAHVHEEACGSNSAGLHYKFDEEGDPFPPNELWPAITTDDDGIGNGHASVHQVAGPTAVSVVVHAPNKDKIACADLQ